MCSDCHQDAETAIELISRVFTRHPILGQDTRIVQDRVLVDAEIHHIDRAAQEPR